MTGALVLRYPGVLISAVAAGWNSDGRTRTAGPDARPPRFRFAVDADTLVVGFDLALDDVRGGDAAPAGAGWYFVLEEPAVEPRFGLDAGTGIARDPAELASWNDLTWDHVAPASELAALTHVRVGGWLADRTGAGHDGVAWGRDAGEIAWITLQRRVRVLVHGSELLEDAR